MFRPFRRSFFIYGVAAHGFAGFKAATAATGVITTRSLLCTGAVLTVTADALGGELRIGAVGIAGLAPSDNVAAMASNVTAAPVRFKTGANFAALVGRNVSLEIRFSNTIVYAVGFAAESSN